MNVMQTVEFGYSLKYQTSLTDEKLVKTI